MKKAPAEKKKIAVSASFEEASKPEKSRRIKVCGQMTEECEVPIAPSRIEIGPGVKLKPRQQLFMQNYALTLNATDSARRAAY